MIASFLDYLALERKYSKHTITAYRNDLNSFLEFCSREFDLTNLDEVYYNQVRSWIVELVHKDISNNSINRKISSLKSFYKFLRKTHQIETSPLAKHKALKVAKKVQVPFTVDEINEVINRLNTVKSKVINDAGHSVPWTHADELLEEINSFLNNE